MVLVMGGEYHSGRHHPFVVADTKKQAEEWLKNNGWVKSRYDWDRRKIIPGEWSREVDHRTMFWARIYVIGHTSDTSWPRYGSIWVKEQEEE